jgi:hypothetical protein
MLAVVALPLLAFEAAVLAVALKDGWGGRKVAGWWWLLRHAGDVRARRAEVQAARTVSDRDLAHLFTGDVTPGVSGLGAPVMLRRASRAYWGMARRAL